MRSICGNSYGCSSIQDNTVGEEMDYNGIYFCFRCTSIAKSIVEFFVGEEIEFMVSLEEWERKSRVMDRLMDTLLGRALVAQGII